jgi:hypothetical protein
VRPNDGQGEMIKTITVLIEDLKVSQITIWDVLVLIL